MVSVNVRKNKKLSAKNKKQTNKKSEHIKLKSMANIILKERMIKRVPVNQGHRFCLKHFIMAPCFHNETC